MSFPHPDSDPPEVSSFEPRTIELVCSRSGTNIAMAIIRDGFRTSHYKTADFYAVRNAIGELITEANEFTKCVKAWVTNTSGDQRRADLEPLIAAGDKLGELLFPEQEAAKFLQKLEKTKAELVVVMALDDKDLNFPWNLVRVPGGKGWLGELACFRLMRDGEGGMRGMAPERDETGVVAGYADDDELMSSRPSRTQPNATQAEFKALTLVADAAVHVLEDLPRGRLDPLGLDMMRDWLSQPLHLFHFNCHAKDPGHPEGFTEIGLRIGARASGEDVIDGMAMTGGVVLDVCSAAQGKEGHWENCFSACLHKRGVPAVCASSCTVTDGFGVRFAEELYKQVPLHDYKLLRAIRAAQEVLLSETEHPMALYYTYEGSERFEIGRY